MDPIADMITRIRNAQMSKHEEVKVSHSRLKEEILKILKHEGFIRDYEVIDLGKNKKEVLIKLKYYNNKPVITAIERISKPGRKIYIKASEIQPVMNNRGIAILSTSKGVMISRKAKKLGVGGEYLIKVW